MKKWKIAIGAVEARAVALITGFAYSFAAENAAAVDLLAIADPEVRACVEQAMPQHAMSQKLTLSVVDVTGARRETTGMLYWKKFENGLAKVFFRIEESPQYEGVAVLMSERREGAPEIFLYSPESRSERRIASSALAGPLLGTDFSYEDFALLQNLTTTAAIKRLEDAEVDGNLSLVIETIPAKGHSSYSRVRTFIDKHWCLPVVTQYFGRNGSLGKELRVERAEVRKSNEHWIPYRSVMHNHKEESRTTLSISKIEIDLPLADDLFTTSQLRMGR